MYINKYIIYYIISFIINIIKQTSLLSIASCTNYERFAVRFLTKTFPFTAND